MFTDTTTLRIGDANIKIRRLTLREIREARSDFATGKDALGEEAVKLVQAHCEIAGTHEPVDTDSLSLPQMRQLLTALVGIPEDSPISDFIGLLL